MSAKKETPNTNPFDDISSLILPQSFTEGQAKKLLMRLAVRKPKKTEWFQVNPNFEAHEVALFEDESGTTKEFYLVAPGLFDGPMAALARRVVLHLGQTRQGGLFLWPIKIAAEGAGSGWFESARDAAKLATQQWVRIAANMPEQAYDIYEPPTVYPNPEWPSLSFSEALQLGFKNHIISDTDHPLYRRLIEGAD